MTILLHLLVILLLQLAESSHTPWLLTCHVQSTRTVRFFLSTEDNICVYIYYIYIHIDIVYLYIYIYIVNIYTYSSSYCIHRCFVKLFFGHPRSPAFNPDEVEKSFEAEFVSGDADCYWYPLVI